MQVQRNSSVSLKAQKTGSKSRIVDWRARCSANIDEPIDQQLDRRCKFRSHQIYRELAAVQQATLPATLCCSSMENYLCTYWNEWIRYSACSDTLSLAGNFWLATPVTELQVLLQLALAVASCHNTGTSGSMWFASCVIWIAIILTPFHATTRTAGTILASCSI